MFTWGGSIIITFIRKETTNQWTCQHQQGVRVNLGYINNSLHLARKYARIFVRGHYLFREANSFPRAKLEENCELRGTDNVQGQISVHIFEAKWMLLCLLSFKYFLLQGRVLGDLFWKLLNVKVNLSALKILLVCSKCLVLFILTIHSG